MFKRVKPHIIKITNDILYSINFPAIISLDSMPFTQKLDILTDPKITNKPNLFFEDEFTTGEYIRADEMLRMYQIILEDCRTIKENNYSITEAIYYIYNKYKERIYQEESKNEKSATSRSLNQITKGSKIVCVGYSNYLNAVASILGIPIYPLHWSDESCFKGHQENIAIINDPVYDIKGVYAIGITWDSKHDETDTTYQNNIRHFLVPIPYDQEEKNHKNLYFPSDECYYHILDRYESLNRLKNYNAPKQVMDHARRNVINAINKLYNLLSIPLVGEDCNIDDEIIKIRMLGFRSISPKTLEEIITRVTPKTKAELNKAIKTSPHYIIRTRELLLLRKIIKDNS